jgi:hypothetical protein
MSEQKSEVQNLTEPTVATEPLDASPLAADTDRVTNGEPKDYPKDTPPDDGESNPTEERPAS